jgi:uncharacterized damage-inducible protein DinB
MLVRIVLEEKIMKLAFFTTVLLALVPTILAQSKSSPAGTPVSNPVSTTVRQMEEHQSKNLIGAAEKMPADKYSYRPTEGQMTFAHLMAHSTEANDNFCAAIAGEQPHEVKLSDSDPKEKLTQALKDSFAYCEQVLAKADDSNLGQPVTLFGSQSTRAGAFVRMAATWADHYSAAAMYLRLNNVLPPSAKH